MIKRLSLLAIVALIGAASYWATPNKTVSTLTLDRIVTTNTHVYPAIASVGRVYFVEKVD